MIKTYVVDGVVIEYAGKYWGVQYDGHGHGEGQVMGWVTLDKANIYDPNYLHSPLEATFAESAYLNDLMLGTIKSLHVVQTTIYTVGP